MATRTLDPIKLFKDDLHAESMDVRISCLKRLRTVGLSLGPERSCSELIPLLKVWSASAEDELLLLEAEALGNFVDVVGGVKRAPCVLEILQMLCSTEETVVREKAAESMCNVTKKLGASVVDTVVVPIVKSLSGAEWFTPRVSACMVIPTVYACAGTPQSKAQVRSIYKLLCADETPMVRRAAAKYFGEYANKVETEFIVPGIVPLFMDLSNDDSDSVQQLVISNCTALAKLLDETENKDHLLPIVQAAAWNKSWRMRMSIAKDLHPLSVAMGKATTKAELLPVLASLLQDHERDVRCEAIKQLPGYCDLIGPEKFKLTLLPTITKMLLDQNNQIRGALAEVVVQLLPKLPKAMSAPVLDVLLVEDTDCKLKLQIISRLAEFGEVLGPKELKEKFVPEVLKLLGKDHQWRMRCAIVKQIPMLTASLGERFFTSDLVTPLTQSLKDDSEAVRLATVEAITTMVAQLGDKGRVWLIEEIVPDAVTSYKEAKTHYDRMIVMRLLQGICKARLKDAANQMFSCWCNAASNRVPNLRLMAAEIYTFLLPLLNDDKDRKTAMKKLDAMLDDQDMDVSYYAKHASVGASKIEERDAEKTDSKTDTA